MILIFTQVKDLDVQHFQWFCLLDLAEVYYDTPHRVVFLTSYEYRIVSSKSISDSLPVVKLSFTSLKCLYTRHCTLFNSGMLVATYDDPGDWGLTYQAKRIRCFLLGVVDFACTILGRNWHYIGLKCGMRREQVRLDFNHIVQRGSEKNR